MTYRRYSPLALLAVAGAACAQLDTVATWDEAGRVIQQAKNVGPNWVPTGKLNGVTIGRTFMMPTPVGATVAAVAAKGTVELTAKGVFALAGRALMNPYLAAAGVIAPLAVAAWQNYGCRSQAYADANVLECDAGVPRSPFTQVMYDFDSSQLNYRWSSKYDAAWARCVQLGQSNGWAPSRLAVWQMYPDPSQSWRCGVDGGGGPEMYILPKNSTVLRCGADINGQPVEARIDERCPTGVYTPTPEAVAVQKPIDYPPLMTSAQYQALVADALGKLKPQTLEGLPEGELRTNVMDSTPLQGPTTNTTNSDGSSESQVTVWNIGRVADDNALRDKETSKWTATKTKTVTSPGGLTTTSTTTESNPSGTTTPGTGVAIGLCTEFPDILGCKVLTDPPAATIPTTTTNIQYAQENLGLGSSCPAPHVMTIRGIDLSLNYQAACNIAPMIRLGLLALAAFACAAFCVRTVTGGGD